MTVLWRGVKGGGDKLTYCCYTGRCFSGEKEADLDFHVSSHRFSPEFGRTVLEDLNDFWVLLAQNDLELLASATT